MEGMKIFEPHERLTSGYDAEQRAIVGLTVIGLGHRLMRELGHPARGGS